MFTVYLLILMNIIIIIILGSWKKPSHLPEKLIMMNYGCTNIQEQNHMFQHQFFGLLI